MTAQQILVEIEPLGKESYRKVLRQHGIPDPMFGVKIEFLKKIQMRIKKDYQLALDLYDTGNYDACYLAGLIADESRLTRRDLQHWLATSNCRPVRSFVVAPVAAETAHGHDLALSWIDSPDENTAMTGWAILSNLVGIKADAELNLAELKKLLLRVQTTIHQSSNFVRYNMNSFVIATGAHVAALTDLAIESGRKIGKVSVDMGDTSCQVPSAPEYIAKIQKRGAIGKKRKSARC